jgi:hypothetical protein
MGILKFIDGVIDGIVASIVSVLGECELFLIVRPIEGFRRIWYHLDPRLYSRRLRIHRITEGGVAVKGNKYILFVLFTKYELPAFFQTLIDAVKRSPLNLIIVSNCHLPPTLRETLLRQCHLVIERADLGRDFGGYKDGISILFERKADIERLIIINDSLFFLEGKVDDLIAGLNGEEDVIGMTEDFHLYYHIQSFALSFSRAVLTNRRFLRYWRTYRPVSTRRWAIQKGERGLTRQLMRAGFRPHILYHGAMLIPRLKALDVDDLLSTVQLMPAVQRARIFDEIDELRENETNATFTAVETLAKSVRRLHRLNEEQLGDLPHLNILQMLTISQQTVTTYRERQRWLLENFGERIVSTITSSNQIHIGGFLFMKFLGMPAFKRDIFYREVYALEEVDEIMSELGVGMKEEVMEELRQRSTARLLKGLPKILYRHGAI